MHFTTIAATLAACAALTLAVPAQMRRSTLLCPPGLESNPQCCATDVLGVADVNCASPPMVPSSISNFTAICASVGQQPKCCAVPILGQALLCESPV